MLSDEQLRSAAARLAAAATRPVTVIVFGSYARGEASAASDLDLAVVEPDLPDKAALVSPPESRPGTAWSRRRSALLFARHDFDRRSQVPATLPYRVRQEGRVLHDVAA